MRVSYVLLAGEKRPVCFSLSAVEELEEKFGSLDKMREELVSGRVAAINSVLEIMLRAGRNYCTAMGIECPAPLNCRPSDLIDVHDGSVVREIFAAMGADTERTVETKQGKN